MRKCCDASLYSFCGGAADKSEDKVRFDDGERIVEEAGEDGSGDGEAVDGMVDEDPCPGMKRRDTRDL